MDAYTCGRTLRLNSLAGVLGALLCSTPAWADLPVPYAMVGCIENGRFSTSSKPASEPLQHPALKALHGKTIRIEGHLGPLHYKPTAVFIVSSKCQKKLLGSYFMCSPCQTMVNQPPSKLIAPHPTGTPIDVPAAAIDELSKKLSRRR